LGKQIITSRRQPKYLKRLDVIQKSQGNRQQGISLTSQPNITPEKKIKQNMPKKIKDLHKPQILKKTQNPKK
jgi:hypothetical protein